MDVTRLDRYEEERGVIDRDGWPSGPWDGEPDRATWVDTETGYDCSVWRSDHLGHLCGYVGVPEIHPLYGKPYDAIDVEIHGGVTFADHYAKHRPGLWWFGFDCAHYDDLTPGIQALLSKTPDDPLALWTKAARAFAFPKAEYRDWAFVVGQVQSLADQIAKL